MHTINKTTDEHGNIARASKFSDCTAPFVNVRAPADSLVRANPQKAFRDCLISPDHGVESGEWICEPGAYRIHQSADRLEIFHVVSGKIRMTSIDSHSVEFDAGDTGVIPPNFQGVFDVVRHTRKIYFVVTTGREPAVD